MNAEEKERAKTGQPVQNEAKLPYAPTVAGEAANAGFNCSHRFLHKESISITG